MSDDSFVHLHLHTEYSLLDGLVRIPDLMKKAKEFKMPAVAITDHGNMYGAIDFFQTAKSSGIKPIIGCEAYMAPGAHTDKTAGNGRDAAFHLTLLAADNQGYANLIKLVSLAHLDGFYYKPRIDKELLAKYSSGLIALSGCMKGEIPMALQQDDYKKATDLAATYRDILGPENFFLEMHDHGIEAQMKINRQLPRLAKDLGLGLVAANDVHFLTREQHEAHDVMICIGTGANVADEKRLHYVPELYFKSPAEMAELFREFPEAISNTVRIAERCNVEIEFGVPKYPNYNPPEGITQNEYLRQLCEEGLKKRYGDKASSEEVQERLHRELGVLEKQGFVNYFLIVWDFINWAKRHGIPVGPGRGSAAGSMIAYIIGITDIDPLRYKLLFERFLNPERVSPPDIDVDFCQNRRPEVIDYVREKYGERAVSQIITFGTLGAKSVLRDVGRVLGWSYGDADRVAKMIPPDLGITLAGFDKKNKETGQMEHIDGAIDKNPELKQAVQTEAPTAQLWQYATTLEGISRNTGVHAAGVVISDRDLSEYIPLTRANDGGIVSQYSMSPLTDLGMLKMDFLGLKTLTVIRDAVNLIHRKEPDFCIDTISVEDRTTFELVGRGETVAVFQLESGGMAKLCREFDIKTIDDLSAILALYRPGPMDLIPDYIKRKKGETKIKYAHPLLEKVCSDTFGVMIYQEQVMAAASVLGGYTLGGADLLRRAMGKKDKEKMAKEREKFVAGCKEHHNIEAKKANEIFDLLEKFAGYGFNKSHSAAYAWVTYQTAFLKANYPVEFMAAVLSNEINNTDKLSNFISECERMDIPILPPDVNKSSLKFAPEPLGNKFAIRYGLAGIKNVGEAAMEAAIEEREKNGTFTSLENFCTRLDSRKVNKKVLESLIKAGAFDWTGKERPQLILETDDAIAASASASRDRASGQSSFFDSFFDGDAAPVKKNVPRAAPWPLREKLGYEKELLGFYVTGHPLDEYRGVLESGRYKPISALAEEEDKSTVQVAGSLVTLEKKFTKKDNKPFAIATIEDLTGSCEVMIWNEAYMKNAKFLEQGAVVGLTGRLDRRDEAPRITVNEVKPLKPTSKGESPVVLSFDCESTSEKDLEELHEAVRQYPGTRTLDLEFKTSTGRKLRLRAGEEYRVNLVPELKQKLERWMR